jgi:hypothetical protein
MISGLVAMELREASASAPATTGVTPVPSVVPQKSCCKKFGECLCCFASWCRDNGPALVQFGTGVASIFVTTPQGQAIIASINAVAKLSGSALTSLTAKASNPSTTISPEDLAILQAHGLVNASGNIASPQVAAIAQGIQTTRAEGGITLRDVRGGEVKSVKELTGAEQTILAGQELLFNHMHGGVVREGHLAPQH